MKINSTTTGTSERTHHYVIEIELTNGEITNVNESGVSEWHAIDKAFTKVLSGPGPYQYDRSKYKIK